MNDANKMPKIVALYLPQFYETEYNNEWWGKGYTEWVACKKSKPLFEGHNQPRIPLNNNYYDLSEKENIRWQMQVAKQYGIDGFAIYQYYSCGDKLLEKPTEMIRDDPSLDLPFFLFWANESWKKMWFGQDRTVVWEQKYGSQKEWREQFEYCLEYFKDNRYLKIDNKPIYGIYNAWNFQEVDAFIECWNRWAAEEGFEGIYFIKSLGSHDARGLGKFSASVTREPNYTFAYDEGLLEKVIRVGKMRVIDWVNRKFLLDRGKGIVMHRASYDKLWKRIIARKCGDEKVILGAFTDWDNSPRKSYNSIIMNGSTPDKFGYYMNLLVKKAQKIGSPMIVINAWNEWAEGAYLEPDEKYGDAYLQQIKKLKDKGLQ